MRAVVGFVVLALVVAACGYSVHQLVLRPGAAVTAAYSTPLDRMPVVVAPPPVAYAPGSPVAPPPVAYGPGSPQPDVLPIPVPARPTVGELVAVLEHGTDAEAAAATHELVAAGEPALAPLAAFQAKWRKTMATLTAAEAEAAAAGEDVDLSAAIRKAGRLAGRAGGLSPASRGP